MNVVFFVESYHHQALANGICVKKVADELIRQGHRVTVFSSSELTLNLPKEENVDGVQVYRIVRDFRTYLRLYSKEISNSTLLKKIADIYGDATAIIHGRIWPLKSIITPLRYTRLAQKKLADEEVDIIVGTYQHIEEVLAAFFLKKSFPHAKTVIYSLDAMAGRETPLLRGKAAPIRKAIEKWERFALKETDIFCAMEAHRDYFEKTAYPDILKRKICYVDIPLLSLGQPIKESICRDNKVIVYTGLATRMTGSPEYLISLIKDIDNVELHLYGRLEKAIEDAISSSGLLGKRVFFHGYVEYEVAAKAQIEADFLATFGSRNKCMISGKIFDYMAKRKPLICTYSYDADANLPYLNKYPNALILSEKSADREAACAELRRFIFHNEHKVIDDALLRDCFFKNTPEATADVFISAGRS